jgi:hypothetical protein
LSLAFLENHSNTPSIRTPYILCILRRNCLLQRVTEGKIQGGIEVTGRRGRRRTKLLDDLKEWRGYSHLKEEALDRTTWRAGFGRGFGPFVRQTTKWMNAVFLACKLSRCSNINKLLCFSHCATNYKFPSTASLFHLMLITVPLFLTMGSHIITRLGVTQPAPCDTQLSWPASDSW